MGTKMNSPNYMNDQPSFYPSINNHNHGLRFQNHKTIPQNCKNPYFLTFRYIFPSPENHFQFANERIQFKTIQKHVY